MSRWLFAMVLGVAFLIPATEIRTCPPARSGDTSLARFQVGMDLTTVQKLTANEFYTLKSFGGGFEIWLFKTGEYLILDPNGKLISIEMFTPIKID